MIKLYIAILINPFSGKGDSMKTAEWIGSKLSLLAVAYELLSPPWPESLQSFTEIWLVGGDGTFNFFLNRYPGNELPLGLFKGGTGNDFAWSLYGDCTLEQNFEKVWTGSPQRIDAASCNDLLFVNSSGIGFDGEVLKSISQIRWLGGHLGYLFIVVKKIFSYRERQVTIRTDDGVVSGKYLLIIVNNAARTGGGFLVTPKAKLTDGLLDFMLCGPLSLLKRLRYLPVIEKGKHLNLPFITYRHVNNVEIESDKSLFAQLDGELINAKKFTFRILPGKLLIKY